ncbi:hypothetical protein STEG23_031994, partial [Scotinomys teguina]
MESEGEGLQSNSKYLMMRTVFKTDAASWSLGQPTSLISQNKTKQNKTKQQQPKTHYRLVYRFQNSPSQSPLTFLGHKYMRKSRIKGKLIY